MLLSVAFLAFAALAACRENRLSSPKKRQVNTGAYNGTMVPQYNISVPVDHFNKSDTRMYNNRYWVNDTYYQPGGPVFFFDGGENGITPYTAAQWLAEIDGTSSVMALAREYHGLAILWEDRYYGDSLPVPFNNTAEIVKPVDDPQGWDYLTVDQALEDVPYFARNMATGGYQRDNMTALAPSNTPWIWIGGSYPAERGAWSRIRSPEIIYAVWASSAIPEIEVDGSAYFDTAERSLPSNCSMDLRTMVAYVDGILAGDPNSQDYLDIQRYMFITQVVGLASLTGDFPYTYNLSDATSFDTLTIGNVLATGIFSPFQDFGPVLTSDIFCNYFESFNPAAEGNVTTDKYISAATNPGNAQPSSEGIIASHGGNTTIGLQAITYALAQYQNYQVMNLTKLASDVNSDLVFFLQDGASYNYQIETQLAWFQGSNPDNITFVSKYLNYTAVQHQIRTGSLSEATINSLPATPDIASINAFGGWNMNPSNVMFTTGEVDPWRAGSVYSYELGSPGNQPTTKVPACGVSPENGTRYGTIYPGAAHVWDLLDYPFAAKLSNDSQGRSPQQAGLELFMAALDVWLPCFNGSSSSNGNMTGPAPYLGQASSNYRPMWLVVGASLSIMLGTMLL